MTTPPTNQTEVGGISPDTSKTIHWSVVTDTYDNITRPHSGTIHDLYGLLGVWQRRSAKTSAKGGLAIIGARFTVGVHTGKNAADYPGEKRWRLLSRVEDCTLLMLDIDGAGCSVEAARLPWEGICRVDWSTHSHGLPSKPGLRMRLLMPYARHVSGVEHRAIYAWAVERMRSAGVDKMDTGTKDPTRLMYGPGSVAAGSLREPWLSFEDGPLLDPDALPGGTSVGELLAGVERAKEAAEAAKEAEAAERKREAAERAAAKGPGGGVASADETGRIESTSRLCLPDLDPKRVLAWAAKAGQSAVTAIATASTGERHYVARDESLFFGNVLAGLDELGACLSPETKARVGWGAEVAAIEGIVRDMEAEAVRVGDNDPTRARAVQWGIGQGRADAALPDFRTAEKYRASNQKERKIVTIPRPPAGGGAMAEPVAVGEAEAAPATVHQLASPDPQARIYAALAAFEVVRESEGIDSIAALDAWADAVGVVAEVWGQLPGTPKLPPSVLLAAVGPQPMEVIEVWHRRAENTITTIDRKFTKQGWRNDDDKAADFLRAASSKDARVEAELGANEDPWRVALAWTMRAEGDEQAARARVVAKLLENFGKYIKPEVAKPTLKATLPTAFWPLLPEAFGIKPKKTKTAEEKAKAKDQGTVLGCLPDAPIIAGAVVPEPWAIRGGAVGKVSKDEDGDERFTEVGKALIIVAGQEDATGERWVTLAFKHWGRWRTRSVPRLVICDRNKLLAELPPCGAAVNSSNAGAFVEWLAAFEDANDDILPRSRVSQQMGWQGTGEGQGFLLGETWIGAKETVEARSDDPNTWREGAWALAQVSAEDARDAVKFSAQREGTFEGWVETVAKVTQYPRVMFALYASLTAPLIRKLGTRSPIIDWSGPPGTGKTSTLRLASSVWGSPREDGQDGGPIGTWNGTIVAHERRAALLGNLPLMLNDSNKAPEWIPGKVIYELAEGAGKQRGAGSGGRQASQQWATVILSNGEQRLIDLAAAKDAGTAHRVISLHGSPWGGVIKEEFLEDFRDGLDANHGHMGRYWIDWLVRYLAQPGFAAQTKDAQRQYKRALSKRCVGNAAANRFAEDFAAILLTAQLVHEAFSLPWDDKMVMVQISNLFDEVAAGAVGLASHEQALNHVWDWASANTEKFWGRRDAARGEPNGGWAGAWRGHDGWTEIAFTPGAIAAILEKHNLKAASIIGDWDEAKWLRRDGKHKRPQVTMGDTTPRLVCIKRSAIEKVCMGIEPTGEVDK